jgi:hypothetical protein
MTSNRHHDEHDDNQVIAWMRDADPVSDLTPLPAWQLERLKETAMTPTTTAAPARSRRRLVAVVGISAAAAAAIIGGVVLAGPGSPGGGVTALSAPAAGGPAAMCAEVTPEGLASSTLAFRGTVTSTADGLVTFRVDDVFTGDVEQTVTVPQGDSDMPVDGAAPVFEDGVTYLVSTTENTIQSCGLTGEDSPELSSLYDQAF